MCSGRCLQSSNTWRPFFLRAAFAERRKMLWKNLERRATPAALERAYAGLGIARGARAEELAPEALYALFSALKKAD